MSEIKVLVLPSYSSIEAIRDISEPWVELWGGDEWGESMQALIEASHTSYGLSDEDCAIIAEILIRNLILQKQWIEGEGQRYGITSEEGEKRAAEKAAELRDYWRGGGNLTGSNVAKNHANQTIDSLPGWLFGEK